MRYTSFILLCFLVSCAQQTPLTGGQKDVTPPQLDSSKTYPPSLATFFNGNEVELVFNDRQKTLSTAGTTIPESKINVYPSLVEDRVYFSKEVESVKIVNLLGKTFVNLKNVQLKELDISKLRSGLYILQLNNLQTVKIFKK